MKVKQEIIDFVKVEIENKRVAIKEKEDEIFALQNKIAEINNTCIAEKEDISVLEHFLGRAEVDENDEQAQERPSDNAGVVGD